MDLSVGAYETTADVIALLCVALLLSLLHKAGWAVLILLPLGMVYWCCSAVAPFLFSLLQGEGEEGGGKDRAGDRRKAKERDAKQKRR